MIGWLTWHRNTVLERNDRIISVTGDNRLNLQENVLRCEYAQILSKFYERLKIWSNW